MTDSIKALVKALLEGCSIAPAGDRFRLRDEDGAPVCNVTMSQVDYLRRWDLLRRKKGLMLIDKRKVRQLHGNSFIKRCYKTKNKAPADQNTPPKRVGPEPVDAPGTPIQSSLF